MEAVRPAMGDSMMANMFAYRITLLTGFVLSLSMSASAQLTEQQAKRIEEAVPKKASAESKKPRRVLIWNTPFMDKCPHKGYSVPQGEHAMRMLGEKTGAGGQLRRGHVPE